MASVRGRTSALTKSRRLAATAAGGGGGAGGGSTLTPPALPGGGGGAAEPDSQTTPSASRAVHGTMRAYMKPWTSSSSVATSTQRRSPAST